MRHCWVYGAFVMLLAFGASAEAVAEGEAATQASGEHKTTLAVLPFIGGTAAEKALAERMRFAVSQKLSNDANGGGTYDRLDNVQVEQVISALGIPWGETDNGMMDFPAEEDMQKVIRTLAVDRTLVGLVKHRTLTLHWYDGAVLSKTAAVDIPSDKESPKQAVEEVLTKLTGATFAPLRMAEVDHSDAALERRLAQQANLVPDPGFEAAASDPHHVAAAWTAILGAEHYAPPLLNAAEAARLGKDKVAVVPLSVAEDPTETRGECLMMRMSKGVAESNGLACESTWIPVTHDRKYRFSVRYHSDGPTARLFLKGFAYKPDKYGDRNDPEATRREFYRAQVLPRGKNKGFELIEMDFTPSSLKATDPKIEWVRVDLYVYLKPGDVFFDAVTVKEIGK